MLYITEGILLEKIEIRDREKSYLVISRDFGKMRGFFKESLRSPSCDLGNIMEITIERKGEINRIKSCRVKYHFTTTGLTFEGIHKFLLLLAFCKKQIPEGGGDGSIYQDLMTLVELSNTYNPEHLVFLCETRFLSLFQYWPEQIKDTTLQKIKKLSLHHPIKDLIKITGIPRELYGITHTYFLQSIVGMNSSI